MLLNLAVGLCLLAPAPALHDGPHDEGVHQDDASVPLADLLLSGAVLAAGPHRFAFDEGFATLPEGGRLGPTHGGVATLADGTVLFTTDAAHAVCAFAADGRFLHSFGEPLAGGLHSLSTFTERTATGERALLLSAHHAQGLVVASTLEGELAWQLPFPESSGLYETPNQYRPTAAVRLPDGRFVVADGYGKSVLHVYSAERAYLTTWGARGSEPGQYQTCHGLWLDEREDGYELIVCDRENHRLQRLSGDGRVLGVVEGMLRRPCALSGWGELFAVADLAGRVTLLNRDFELVGHLGDHPDTSAHANYNWPADRFRPGLFQAPHGIAFGPNGDLYVLEWSHVGRVTKLARLP
ncbi:MAG: NHL repeat-containing protein [Planctomycetota bacterium]|jgi:hypothetical protein